jgi:uncharacterized membrane protein
MIQLLLKFLGVRIDAAQEVSSASLQLRQSGWLGWVVFVAMLLGVFTWWTYRHAGGHRDLKAGRRRLLTGLRILLFLLLLFMLLRPVFSFTVENRLRRTLIMLVDKSGSMNIEDLRREDADIKRAAIGKGLIDRTDQPLAEQQAAELRHIPRTELVKAVFDNSKLALLESLKKRYDIEYLVFGRSVSVATEEQALKTPPPDDDNSQSTAIGDAIRDVINRKRGQPVAGVLLVTDGANNSGSEPLDAASAAHQEHVPLYIYGVGITSPRDIIVDSVFTPEVAFIKDEVPVTVRVRAQGLKGEKARLTLKLDGKEVAGKDLEFSDEAGQAVPLTFTPQTAGEFDLTASIPPREDETVKDNNSASQRLRVIDSKIKVLYVEQAPRWEFRFIQSALLRDRRVDAKFLLLQADPELSKAEGSPYLEKFPVTKEDLFKYDLVVIGDVDPKTFTPGQLDGMNEFVSKFGGAMIFIAGQQFNPPAYANTPLAKLLPVETDEAGVTQGGSQDRSTTLALTNLGRASPMLKLAPNEQENELIWKNFPPIHWINRVSRVKPGAQVLLEDTDPAKTTRFGKMPAMALQQYGVGQVLYIGTDDTWRWRQETGVAYHPLLWGQITQRMALAHLLGGSKRTQLSVDKQRYNTAERVTVFARLYDKNFDPVKLPSVNGLFTVRPGNGQPESPQQSVQLRALPDQPGMYRGDFVPVVPGTYKFHLESDPQTSLDMAVTKASFELGDTAMNEPVLKEMARISDGAFFREEDLANLTQSISQKDERISRVVDADIWSSPFYFLLVVLVAVTEWVLRKKSELK